MQIVYKQTMVLGWSAIALHYCCGAIVLMTRFAWPYTAACILRQSTDGFVKRIGRIAERNGQKAKRNRRIHNGLN